MSKKKIWNIYILFLLVYFIIILLLACLEFENFISHEIVQTIISFFGLLLLGPLIVWGIIAIVKYFVGSITNIHTSKDSLFKELDYYRRHWGETKEHYQDMINAINFYYAEGGKVDTAIGNDLCRLYNRKDFLERSIDTTGYLSTCLLSVGLSICATLFLDNVRANDRYQTLYMIIVMLLFFAVILIKFSDLFNDGGSQIYKYELNLLNKKIEHAENKVCTEFQSEDMLLTKQNILITLMEKGKTLSSKKYDDVTNDIRTIEQMNLFVDKSIIHKEEKFIIGKTKRVGVLYFGTNDKLVNCQYKKLYHILRKYDLIYKIESEEIDTDDIS